MMPRPLRLTMACALACAAAPAVVRAQVAAPTTDGMVDEGSFTILRKGVRIGRETFTIRRSIEGAENVYIANATVDFDAQRLSPALRTDSSYAPLAYQMEVRTNDQLQLRLKGVIGRGRFSARVRTPSGESAKEYIVSEGALVIDDMVFHQYYFLAQRVKGSAFTVPVVIPQRNVQLPMHVQTAGVERITIGGTPVDAHKLVAAVSGAGTRDIWVDGEGRVLKVVHGDITAVRDELPH
jgi:hypothetical protein